MELQFTTLNKITLTEQVMQQLASKIISGELKPGEKLPPERDLAEMLQVSRSRVREALRALSLIGLVSIRPGGGTYVGNHIDQMPEETVIWLFRQQVNNYSDIYEARRLIEVAVYESCFMHRTDAIVQNIRKYVTAIARAYENNVSPEEFNQCLEEEDIYVGKNCGNAVFYKLMQTIVLLRRESATRICESAHNRKTSVEKRRNVALAFEGGDFKQFHRAINNFFDQSVKDFTFEK